MEVGAIKPLFTRFPGSMTLLTYIELEAIYSICVGFKKLLVAIEVGAHLSIFIHCWALWEAIVGAKLPAYMGCRTHWVAIEVGAKLPRFIACGTPSADVEVEAKFCRFIGCGTSLAATEVGTTVI